MAQILLVDDEKVARSLYGDFLVGAGHTVTAVSDVDEARKALETSAFDLMVTDLILPQANGMDLLQHCKRTRPDVEIIVITGLDKVEPAVRAIKSGASDYLIKPVSPETLAHAVNRALSHRSLLRENETLRTHVGLLEAGQRIATTLDGEKLFSIAASTFLASCQADAAAVFKKVDAGYEVGGTLGFSDPERQWLTETLTAQLRLLAPQISKAGERLTLSAIPDRFGSVFGVPAWHEETLLGAVLLFYTADPAPAVETAAPFLARHYSMGLRTLGKFSAFEDLVYLDDLTHLFNSRYLDVILDKEFKKVGPRSDPFSLLFLDLDYFKSVNDVHGHLIGSKLLVEVSKVLKNCVRDNDVVCRWGGDEFVCLLRGTDSGGALKVAERIRRSVETHRFLAREGFSLNITTCIGVASCPEHATEKSVILDFSDRAMYRGKKGTRNIIYMAAPGQEAPPASRQQNSKPPQS